MLAKKAAIEVNWEIPGALLRERAAVARYPLNPEKNWGPKARAGSKAKAKKRKTADVDGGADDDEMDGAGTDSKRAKTEDDERPSSDS